MAETSHPAPSADNPLVSAPVYGHPGNQSAPEPDEVGPTVPRPRVTRRALVSAAGVAAFLAATGGTGAVLYAREPATPWYVTDGPEEVRRSYAFAVDHPEVLRHIPCYCDCGRRDGHGSVLDCYVAGRDLFDRPRYDDHGVACPICTAIVQQVRQGRAAGKPLAQIRAEVDNFFAPYAAYATDTEPPGEGHGGH